MRILETLPEDSQKQTKLSKRTVMATDASQPHTARSTTYDHVRSSGKGAVWCKIPSKFEYDNGSGWLLFDGPLPLVVDHVKPATCTVYDV